MGVLNNIEPKSVMYYFEKISSIPRGSGNEKGISDYIKNFAVERSLYCYQDEANNVLIKKPGTDGYENSPAVILQGHIDMVCEKNSDIEHNFLTDPLKLRVDDDLISAEGTTLGADNGIAVAYMLAVLDSSVISHPPIEALFTTDEEVGLLGAKFFDGSKLSGKTLINMDTEEEGSLLVSCCGGIRANLHIPVSRICLADTKDVYKITIKGLKGGHSGADIHLQRASANKLMGRVLTKLFNDFKLNLVSVNGGTMDNAICREAEADVVIDVNELQEIKNSIKNLEKSFINEYKTSDKEININIGKTNEKALTVFDEKTASNIICALTLIPYGVKYMSLEINGLVESSSNIGIVKTTDSEVVMGSSVRSSVSSRKYLICEEIEAIAKLCGGSTSYTGDYPGWEYNPQSEILEKAKDVYNKIYKSEPKIEAIHAGLECGLFGEKIPGLDMVSFGPNMYDVHTPDERLSISSTQRVWLFLLELLKNLK